MLEQFAVWLGRNVNIRGSGRMLSMLYPHNHRTARYLDGIRTRGDGMLMKLDSRNWIDWNLLFRGDYEPHLTSLLRELVPADGVAVDIGANIGTHTLTLARTVGPTGAVLAFEPNPPIRSVLERNVILNNLENVRIFDCALGDKQGLLPLRVPKADSVEYSNMGMASLVALDSPHELVDVRIYTLDEIFSQTGLNRLDVVKVDVQGYECQVLTGMNKVLANYAPIVIFEYEAWAWDKAGMSMDNVTNLFKAAGYQLWRFVAGGLSMIEPLPDLVNLRNHCELVAFRSNDHRLRMLTAVAEP